MITKTTGMVLSHVAYGETSIIVKIYTRDHGYQSFIVNSVRSARSRHGMAHFQPTCFLDLVIYLKPSRDIQRISEFKSKGLLPQDIKKQAVLLFLAEVLQKLLRNEQEENQAMFDFIFDGISLFNAQPFLPNFHIQFLLKLTPFIGLSALSGRELFENMNRIADQADVEHFIESLISSDYLSGYPVHAELRRKALDALVHYFAHHLDGFGKVLSLNVLSHIFR